MDRTEQMKIMTDLCVKLREQLKGLIKAGMYIVPAFCEEEDDWIIYVNLYNRGDRSVYTVHHMLERIHSGDSTLVNEMAYKIKQEYKNYILSKYFM